MGNSHYKSNLYPKTGAKVDIKGFATVTCATVAATNLVVGTAASAPAVTVSSYIKIGTGANRKFIFFSGKNTAASLPAEATLTCQSATILGSIVLAGNGLYRFSSNTVASLCDQT
jgi:hypothetical protein